VTPTVFETLTFKARKWLVFPTLPCLTTPLWGAVRNSALLEETAQELDGWDYRMLKISQS